MQYTGENEKDVLECRSCGQMFNINYFCEHDWNTEHQWCQGCCEDSDYKRENDEPRLDWNDLD